MAKATILSTLRNNVAADSIGKNSKGNFVFRKGYFYRHGVTAESFANQVVASVVAAGLKCNVVDAVDKWAPFNGRAKLANSSHFWVECNVTAEEDHA